LPVLKDGDFRLAQGPVIMAYLAKKHGIAPADPRLSAWADSVAWGAEDLRTRYNALFGSKPTAVPAEFARNVWEGRWMPTFEALLAQNGDNGHFAGDTLTHADIAVWDIVDACVRYVAGCKLDSFPKVAAFYDAIGEIPAVATYIASRTE
jgi:glutathione S-transferase